MGHKVKQWNRETVQRYKLLQSVKPIINMNSGSWNEQYKWCVNVSSATLKTSKSDFASLCKSLLLVCHGRNRQLIKQTVRQSGSGLDKSNVVSLKTTLRQKAKWDIGYKIMFMMCREYVSREELECELLKFRHDKSVTMSLHNVFIFEHDSVKKVQWSDLPNVQLTISV